MQNESRQVVLALDLGTTTGWAVCQRDGTLTSGSCNFKPKRFEGGGMRFLRFKHWLSEIYSIMGEIHIVYFEEVRKHAGTDAAHVYGGFMGHLTAWCEARKIPYAGVPVGVLKKSATGKGNASKEEMIAAMVGLGFAPEDDNEADALALLQYGLNAGGV